jgi:hypothetical protein
MFEFGASHNEPEYERPTWRRRSVYRNLDNFWFADESEVDGDMRV